MIERKINRFQTVSFILIGVTILGFVLIFSQFYFLDKKPENFGALGDAIGGILNPIIAIAAALLTFLAFIIQKIANDDIRKQFLQQQDDAHKDFLFKNYKDRIFLIINELNQFNISFHGGTLITEIAALDAPNSKKYNFIGIQAINLFLVEYFKLKNRNHKSGKTEVVLEESYHAILLHIQNLITAYYNVHKEVLDSELESKYKNELLEILQYIFYSKFCYFFEILGKNHIHEKTKEQMDYFLKIYDSRHNQS